MRTMEGIKINKRAMICKCYDKSQSQSNIHIFQEGFISHQTGRKHPKHLSNCGANLKNHVLLDHHFIYKIRHEHINMSDIKTSESWTCSTSAEVRVWAELSLPDTDDVKTWKSCVSMTTQSSDTEPTNHRQPAIAVKTTQHVSTASSHNTHRLEFRSHRKTAVTHSETRQTTCWHRLRRTAHSHLHRSFKNESGAATGAQRPQMRVAYPGREDQRLQPESESNAVKPAQSIWNIPTQDSSVWQNNFLFLSNRDFHALKLKLEFWNPEGKRLINEQTSRFCAVVSVCMCVCVCVRGLVTEVRGEGHFLSGCVHDTHSWKTLATWVPHSSLPLTPAEVSKHAAHTHTSLYVSGQNTPTMNTNTPAMRLHICEKQIKQTQIPPHNLTSLLVEA